MVKMRLLDGINQRTGVISTNSHNHGDPFIDDFNGKVDHGIFFVCIEGNGLSCRAEKYQVIDSASDLKVNNPLERFKINIPFLIEGVIMAVPVPLNCSIISWGVF